MNCSTCGAENELGRKFCLECGARLTAGCPKCGAANTPGAKFCGECGTALTDMPAVRPAVAAAPATERRLVSVLFADLVGFTTLSEARDPEDVRALLDRYFEACREVIARYGGTVEKFIGDAVMAVWGTPVAQEDDAERAVRAGLDLVEAVGRLGSEGGVSDLALRAGVHTGEAVVTIGATGMGMVAGDLVNTASRLQSVAPPGTVLVGEGTRRAADTAIVFEAAGEQELKGKVSPVPAFRALRVVAQRGGVGRNEGLEPPFVGRHAELQLVKDFYHATARERGPRLVSVIGQAGIGKSRLAWEFLKYIDGVTEIVYWHQGRSPAYGEGISFWSLGEMVRMRIGIGEGTDEATTRQHLSASLEEFVTDADERRSLTDPLLHLLGIGEAPARERGQLFLAWRTFFERIAEAAPVVMVFEDLQWADDGLLDFIEELLTWSRGRSIYLITLARPELLDRRPTWGAGQRSFTSLSLAPLPDEEVASLLAGLVPGIPDGALREIVERAEGIPLYAVETVRMLLNDGRIERDGDTFRPVGDLSHLAVPESLHALIAARIDGLAPVERTLVQDASVLGLSFSQAALTAVSRAAPDELQPMVEHLLQREVFTIDEDPRSPERGNFRFVQGLLREVAYGTLARDDRRARHLAAARYYEALGDDELSGVLAQHYVDAYQAHPDGPEGRAVAAQARVALRGASQRAADLGSHRTALSYLESAMPIVDDPDEELDLRALAHSAAGSAGLMDAALTHGERVVELATQLGRDLDRRMAIARNADIMLEGRQAQSLELLKQALEEPGMDPGAPGYIDVVTVLAKAEMRVLNDGRAVELTDHVLPVARVPEDNQHIVDLLITRGVSLANLGRSVEAEITLIGALDVARRLGLRGQINRAAVNLGYALAQDDPMRSFQISREAIEEAKRHGVIWELRYIVGNAVDGAIEVGEWDWAMDIMSELDPLFTETAERIWFGTFSSVIRAYRGEDVRNEVQEIYEVSRQFDDLQYKAVGAYGLVADALVRGELQEVIRISEETMGLSVAGLDGGIYGARAAAWLGDAAALRRFRDGYAAGPGGRRTEALLATMDGSLATLEGRTNDARALFADARRIGLELACPYWVGWMGLDIVTMGALEAEDRRRAAEEARQVFAQLRAAALLDLLDDAVTRDEAIRPPHSTRDRDGASEPVTASDEVAQTGNPSA
ncbi:MAG TPA: adenylate/guanylate cyclase domain-containing protein [Candidatus Limnocylindria bacterium]